MLFVCVCVPPLRDRRMTQRVDHFNPQDLRTFQQRYWVNAQYFTGAGPVYMFIGGESTGGASPCARVPVPVCSCGCVCVRAR